MHMSEMLHDNQETDHQRSRGSAQDTGSPPIGFPFYFRSSRVHSCDSFLSIPHWNDRSFHGSQNAFYFNRYKKNKISPLFGEFFKKYSIRCKSGYTQRFPPSGAPERLLPSVIFCMQDPYWISYLSISSGSSSLIFFVLSQTLLKSTPRQSTHATK